MPCISNEVAPVKTEIKAWLKANSLSREWIAEKIGVSKRTVDNWLSSNIEIPPRSIAAITALMDDTAKIADGLRSQVFSVECSLEQFRQFSRAALEAGQTLEEWSVSVLESEARDYFASQRRKGLVPASISALPAGAPEQSESA